MPKIEYKEDGKIDRRFTPQWRESGQLDPSEEIMKYARVLKAAIDSMVEYIEKLHNEIDRQKGKGRIKVIQHEDKKRIDEAIDEKLEEIAGNSALAGEPAKVEETRRQALIYGIRYITDKNFLDPYPGIRIKSDNVD